MVVDSDDAGNPIAIGNRWPGTAECEEHPEQEYLVGDSIRIDELHIADLTGDGADDAVVTFRFHPCGGNHGRSRTCVVHSTTNDAEYLADCFAGEVENVRIENGAIKYVGAVYLEGDGGACGEGCGREECIVNFTIKGERLEPVCEMVKGDGRRITRISYEPPDAEVELPFNADSRVKAPGFVEFEVNDRDFGETYIHKAGYKKYSFDGVLYPEPSYTIELEQDEYARIKEEFSTICSSQKRCISLRFSDECSLECAKEVAAYLSNILNLEIQVVSHSPLGPAGCIGYRKDIGGTRIHAEMLLEVLGKGYYIGDIGNCTSDGYAINLRAIKLSRNE